jgi:hypothetical protein
MILCIFETGKLPSYTDISSDETMSLIGVATSETDCSVSGTGEFGTGELGTGDCGASKIFGGFDIKKLFWGGGAVEFFEVGFVLHVVSQ